MPTQVDGYDEDIADNYNNMFDFVQLGQNVINRIRHGTNTRGNRQVPSDVTFIVNDTVTAGGSLNHQIYDG